MIVRIRKRERPYVQIDKSILEIETLSWRAKGIVVYLLSKPDGWVVQTGDILTHGTEGRDAVISAMKELQDHGFAWVETPRNPDGTLAGRQWVISEERRSPENPVIGAEALENRSPENPKIGKSPTNNNEYKERMKRQFRTEVGSDRYLSELQELELYSRIDVRTEFLKAQLWTETHSRRLTDRTFVNWLNNAIPSKPVNGSQVNGHQPPASIPCRL